MGNVKRYGELADIADLLEAASKSLPEGDARELIGQALDILETYCSQEVVIFTAVSEDFE